MAAAGEQNLVGGLRMYDRQRAAAARRAAEHCGGGKTRRGKNEDGRRRLDISISCISYLI